MSRFRRLALVTGLVLLAVFLTVMSSLAVHDLDLFELDRNVTEESYDDWETLYGGGGGAAEFTGIIEDTMGTNPLGSIGTQFQAGGSKDDLDISPDGATKQSWKWEPGEPLDKDDITNAYAAAYVNTVDTGENNIGDLIVFFGLDRFANNGSAQVGFWFVQDPEFGLTTTTSGGGYLFSGHHEVGDIVVQSNFSQGGVIDTISIYEWVGAGGSDDTLDLLFSAQDCATSAGDDPACATVNQGDTPSLWPFVPKFGVADIFPHGSFFEGGINITRLVPDAGCFTGFMAETRSSTPFDARLKDFALGEFELCSIAVTKSGDTLSKVGDDVEYTIEVENTGAITLYKQSIVDDLLGDLTDGTNPLIDSSDCGASLAPGATCTIEATRTVAMGDPDPLKNTVEVVYNASSDLLGDEVSSSDDHEVELFQPSIKLTKSSDVSLTKVDHDIVYTVVIENTSSDDTPDLVIESISDTLQGDLTNAANYDSSDCGATLASGASCTVVYTHTVLVSDADPLKNTASVETHPTGFTNDIDTSDDAEVELFQPDIAVAKTGDELSKVGDEVNYTITLSNNSSADTPAMICTATDTLLGTVFGPDATLPLGDMEIDLSRTVQEGDPDPLVNEVSLTCSPDGFLNILNAGPAVHSTNLFQPDVEVIKTGPDTATRGELINYDFTINNLSSDDSPDLVLESVTDTVLGDLTAAAAAGGCETLASPDGTCNFSVDYTVAFDDPNPLVNVVSVLYHPQGFPNDITDDDDHSVLIPVEGCTPGFWQGGAGAQQWDEVNDPDWTGEGTNPYIHTTLFNDFFNDVTDPRLDGYTMYQLVSSGGGSDPAIKAARDMVAAYLNETAFPVGYPADSLAELSNMWYGAVTAAQGGDDSLFDAFHNTVSGWNAPEPPGYCPLP